MKKYVFSLAVILAFLMVLPSSAYTQECQFFYPTEIGTTLEYTYYNKKGREDGYQSQKVVNKKDVDGATVIEIEATNSTGKKNEEVVTTNFEVKCDDGKFYMNMKDFTSTVNYDQYEGNPDVDVTVDADELFYPSDLSVGQVLPDGKVELAVAANGAKMFGTTITIKDRKVEAQESITTPAGTFECYKISSTIITKAIMSMETKTIQWITKDLGIIKTENLSSKGKLVSYQLLTGIKE